MLMCRPVGEGRAVSDAILFETAGNAQKPCPMRLRSSYQLAKAAWHLPTAISGKINAVIDLPHGSTLSCGFVSRKAFSPLGIQSAIKPEPNKPRGPKPIA